MLFLNLEFCPGHLPHPAGSGVGTTPRESRMEWTAAPTSGALPTDTGDGSPHQWAPRRSAPSLRHNEVLLQK